MKKINAKTISAILVLALIVQIFVPSFMGETWAAPGTSPVTISKAVNDTTVEPGEIFSYEINYSVNSTTKHFQDVVVHDDLPAGVEFISITEYTDVINADTAYDSGTHSLNILLSNRTEAGKKMLDAGTTGKFQINVRIMQGVYQNGSTFVNIASVAAIDSAPYDSDPVTVTAINSEQKFELYKRKLLPSGNPTFGNLIKYEIEIDETSNRGRIPIKDVIIKDSLPDNTKYVSHTGNGTYHTTDHAIIWNEAQIPIGGRFVETVTVRLTGPGLATGQSIINTVTAAGLDSFDNPVDFSQKQVTLEIIEPTIDTAGSNINKSVAYYYRTKGQTQQFTINNISHSGNVNVNNFRIEDNTLPQQISYTSIQFPAYDAEDIDYTISYTLNGTDWVSKKRSELITTKNTLTIQEITSQTSLNLHGLKIIWGEVGPDYNGGTFRINGIVNTDVFQQVTNTAIFTYDEKTTPSTDTVSFEIIGEKPYPTISKSIIGGNNSTFMPKSLVNYRLTISNHRNGTGILKKPIVVDILPENITISGPATISNGIDKTNLEYIVTEVALTDTYVDESSYNSSGLGSKLTSSGITTQALIWKFDADMNINSSFTIDFNAYIDKYTPNTKANVKYYNTAYVTTLDHSTNGFLWGNDTDDWDARKDSIHWSPYLDKILNSGSEVYLRGYQRSTYINKSGKLQITKENKGDLDADFNTYPASGSAIAGGTADYKIILKNEGNAVIKNIDVMDVLPYIGDTSILPPIENRGSEWKPNLLKALTEGLNMSSTDEAGNTVTFDLDVDYSVSNNLDVVELIRTEPSDLSQWMDTIPNDFDITSIKTLYLQLTNINGGAGLDSGESIEIYWKMRAPVGTPENLVAWGSVATEVQLYDDDYLLPTEPIKVGFRTVVDSEGEIGDFVWFDGNADGIQGDGYDEQKAGINGIKAKLYYISSTGQSIFVDETITADNHDGLPGYYLFPNLPSSSINGLYQVEFEIPDYYTVTTTTGDTEILNSAVENDSDFDSTYIKSSTKYTSVSGINLIKNPALDYPYRQPNWDLGLVGAAQQKASAVVTKSAHTTDPFEVGDEVTYTIEILNDGTVPLNNVKVFDVMEDEQSGFVFEEIGKSISGLEDVDTSVLVNDQITSTSRPGIEILKILPSETIFITGTYTVLNADVATDSGLINTVSVYANEFENGQPIEKTSTIDIIDLDVTKNADVSEVEPGSTSYSAIIYTVTVINNGNITIDNLIIEDYLIPLSTLVTNGNVTTDVVGAKVIKLTPGATETIKYTYISQLSDLGDDIKNIAKLKHTDMDDKNSSEIVVETKGLEVTKEIVSVGPYKINDEIDYRIIIRNLGSKRINGIEYADLLFNKNAGIDYTLLDSSTFNLNGGATRTFNLTYKLKDSDVEILVNNDLKNKVVVTASALEKKSYEDEVKSSTHDMKFTKTAAKQETGFLSTSSSIIYDFEIINTGSDTLHDVVINDARIGYSETIAQILAGETATRQAVYQVKASDLGGQIINIAEVTSSEGAIASDTAIIGEADIQIIKNVILGHDKKDYIVNNYDKVIVSNDIRTTKGSDITYVFTVVNTGDTHLKDVRISDSALGLVETDLIFIPELSDALTFSSNTLISADNEKLVFYVEGISKGTHTNTAKTFGKPAYEDGTLNTDLAEVDDADTAKTTQPSSPVVNTASLGDQVWVDKDEDGIMDSDEEGIANVLVYLKTKKGTLLRFTKTDGDGQYLFENLSNGDYVVELDTTILNEEGYHQTYDLDGGDHYISEVKISGMKSRMDVDFGYNKTDDPLSPTEPAIVTDSGVTTEGGIEEEPDTPDDPDDTDEPEGIVIIETDDDTDVEVITPPDGGTVVVDDGDVIFFPDDEYDGEDSIEVLITLEDGTEELFEIEITDDLVPLGYPELPKTGVNNYQSELLIAIACASILLVINNTVKKKKRDEE